MKNELFKHKLAYTVLILVLTAATIAFLASWPNMLIQRLIIAAMALFYFGWGVFTHVNSKTLNPRVALEYGVVAMLGAVILTALTL